MEEYLSGWENRRILITGGSGFIGSHLTRRLVRLGADVAITTKYNSIIDNVRLADIWDQITVLEADMRNMDALNALNSFGAEIVFHLAAYNHVGDSFLQVSESMDSNGKGTSNLCTALKDYERFVYISTSEVYGAQHDVPFVETMIPKPVSPYSVGKHAGEQYCRMMMEDMDLPVAIIRPFNAFGPYQSTRAVIAEMILTCLEDKPIYATEGVQTREFNFVSNLVDGFLCAGRSDKAVGQITNIGAGEEIAIRDLIKMIHKATDSRSELHIGALENRPTEIWRMYCDNRKALENFGWSPRVSFEEGIYKTVAWFREFHSQFRDSDKGNAALARLASDGV